MRTAIFLLAIASRLFAAHSTTAAIEQLRPSIGGVLNTDLSAVDPTFVLGEGLLRPRDQGYVIQIDIYMSITELNPPAQVGFGNAAFDVLPGAEFSEHFGVEPWRPDTTVIDANGDLAGGMTTKWAELDDPTTSLQGIVIGTAPRSFGPEGIDPRRTLGQSATGDYAGSVFLDLPAVAGTVGEVVVEGLGASTYDASLNLSIANNASVGGSLAVSIVPEPSSAMLAGVAAVAIAYADVRRRRERDRPGDESP